MERLVTNDAEARADHARKMTIDEKAQQLIAARRSVRPDPAIRGTPF